MIRPVIEYGSVIYDNLTAMQNIKLEKLQRRAAVICTGAISRTESRKLLSELGWNSLKERREKSKLLLMYKILNKLTPEFLVSVLELMRNVKTRSTRNSNFDDFSPPFLELICLNCLFFLLLLEIGIAWSLMLKYWIHWLNLKSF